MKAYLAIILLLLFTSVNAQTKTDPLETDFSLIEKKIDPLKFLGIWENIDSIKYQIEFFFQANEFKLSMRQADAKKDLFYAYSFFRSDTSSSLVSDCGVIIMWPPNYCHVKQIDENNIEVRYQNFGGPTIPTKYRRVAKKSTW